MDERAFTDRRRPEWERLAAILRQASSRGIRSLSGAELVALGKLYRRVASDLSYVKANSANEDLVLYLNELAGRAHGYLYADAPRGTFRSVSNFLLRGFPILFRAKWRFIAAAAAIFLVASIFAAAVVIISPDTGRQLIPSQFG
jgi:hypothetical protein